MNLVRSFFSIFLVAFIVISIAGWIWAGDLPSAELAGARVVLTLSGLAAAGCLWSLWRVQPMDVADPLRK